MRCNFQNQWFMGTSRVMGSFIPGVYLPERQIRALEVLLLVWAECLLITKEDIWHLMDVPIEGLWGEYSLACSLRDGDRLGELSIGPFCLQTVGHWQLISTRTLHGRVLESSQITSGNGTIDQAVDGWKFTRLGWMAVVSLWQLISLLLRTQAGDNVWDNCINDQSGF